MAKSINVVVMTGRLVRDAELKYINTGTALSKFTIAVDNGFGDHKKTFFFDWEMWGKMAEAISQYMTKGGLITVSGEAKQDKWEQEGQTRTKISFRATDVVLPQAKSGESSGSGFMPEEKPKQPARSAESADDWDNPKSDFGDEIPF